MRLKSTNQTIFSMPWTGDSDIIPWNPEFYRRVFIAYPKRSKSGHYGYVAIVRKENIVHD